MTAYALYRLPHEQYYVELEQTCGEPEEVLSFCELCDKTGFVLAPFAASYDTPILIIRPDRMQQLCVENANRVVCDVETSDVRRDRERYAAAFSRFHDMLRQKRFGKIVLSRCSEVPCRIDQSELRNLFLRACNLYPRMFVALVATSKSGVWLMATPEILVESSDTEWKTMALAGTMKLSDYISGNPEHALSHHENRSLWNEKNRSEQRMVASYIAECLERLADGYTEGHMYTVRAGDLVHLRSDFTFRLKERKQLGELLEALHPTPAVCGLPKRETLDFIVKHEGYNRKYYSGFAGPLFPDTADTHLFVTLRCINIAPNVLSFYAGGGLLPASDEQREWEETEAKMQTMKKCFI